MIELIDLHKSFGRRRAVDGVTLSIERGEVFGLLGPNGAGKTTTIAMATGLLRPDSGAVRVRYDGREGSPQEPRVRALMGVAPQSLALYDELTAEENLRFFGRVYGLRGAVLASRVGELLEAVGLTERRRGRVDTFSGGMKRRLNLAVALVHDPALLLLDEPTVGVDPQSRASIFGLVERLKGEGRTVLYTTHYMEEAQRLCDRVGILDHGRLLALDTVDRLCAAHAGKSRVVVMRDGGEERIETETPVEELTRQLGAGDVRAVRVERPGLEEVFLSLTGRSLRD